MAGDHVAVDALGLFGEPLEEAGGIHHLAHGLGQGLALLAAEQLGQFALVGQHQLGPAPQRLAALLGGKPAPGRQGAFGGGDGEVGFLGPAPRHFGDQLAVGRVAHRVAVALLQPAAVDMVSLAQQPAHATASWRLKASWAGRATRRMRLPAV
ncbi:hypothetical protein FQZ97_935660 [compost metagenome]